MSLWGTGLSLSLSDVSAVIVTRGDVDLRPVLELLPFEDVVIWDNSKRRDVSVYGRYLGTLEAKNEIIYVQDDDALFADFPGLLAEYEEGKIVCNMPVDHRRGEEQALVGWGSLFSRCLAWDAFKRWPYHDYISPDYPDAEALFHRTCDIVFTVLTPFKRVDLGKFDLPHAHHPHKMHLQPGYHEERELVLQKALELRDAHSLGI